ncbi:V-type ATP synthase subunit E [Maledivibacter halophilus]|uniref:H+-ATPase subunit E/Vma4 n=1 Tax=Maledivibacter halophilus TaxID=36842 RepID=A0A1T5JZI7_9FIRM|nr:V-type ATP synthase subunit E family protein [Maledivibacter halophilus]SKC56710.1 H+-ATPase subunit E/Vma4 [Maledivibacter halophilus]
MITMEGKLDVFTKLVLEKVQREYEEKKREIEKGNNEAIQKHKLDIEEKSNKIISNMINKGEIQKNRLVSKAKVEKKRVLLSKKEELLGRIIDNIRLKAVQFTYEDNYRAYMEESLAIVLENLKNKKAIILFIRDNDRPKFNKMINNLIKEKNFDTKKVEFESLKDDAIGGVIGVDKEKTIKVDCSIKTRIEDNRNLMGQRLYDVLNSSQIT